MAKKKVDEDVVIIGTLLLVAAVGTAAYFIGRREGWNLCWNIWETYHEEVISGTLTKQIFD